MVCVREYTASSLAVCSEQKGDKDTDHKRAEEGPLNLTSDSRLVGIRAWECWHGKARHTAPHVSVFLIHSLRKAMTRSHLSSFFLCLLRAPSERFSAFLSSPESSARMAPCCGSTPHCRCCADSRTQHSFRTHRSSRSPFVWVPRTASSGTVRGQKKKDGMSTKKRIALAVILSRIPLAIPSPTKSPIIGPNIPRVLLPSWRPLGGTPTLDHNGRAEAKPAIGARQRRICLSSCSLLPAPCATKTSYLASHTHTPLHATTLHSHLLPAYTLHLIAISPLAINCLSLWPRAHLG